MPAKVIKEYRLIYVDPHANNNKWWTGQLLEGGDVYTEWGRIGGKGESKTYPGVGEAWLDKKAKSKYNHRKTPYVDQKTVGTVEQPKAVARQSLKDIALRQISVKQPEIRDFITYLVDSNIHQITSGADISYDADTGLFQTPLGIVTSEGLAEARSLLSEIEGLMDNRGHAFDEAVKSYFRIIPQKVGHRFDVNQFFGDRKGLQKQLELVEALEASYEALAKGQTKDKDKDEDKEEEKIFDLELSLLPASDSEFKRINKLYESTKDSGHGRHVTGMRIKKIYRIERHPIREEAEKAAAKKGNVMELWHGSNHANLLSILQGGLRVSPPSSARIAGKAFGNGIYFADCSTKSLNYSVGSWHGTRYDRNFLFLAKVTMGKTHVASRAFESFPKRGTDSTSALRGKTASLRNNEFIIYSNELVDLRYLIEVG